MNEQIIITYGDTGIEIEVIFLNSKKKAIDITDNNIEITFVSPSTEKETRNGIIVNGASGIASYILDSDLTSEEGLWKTYWSCYNEDGYITAQEAIYYYILPKFGGE